MCEIYLDGFSDLKTFKVKKKKLRWHSFLHTLLNSKVKAWMLIQLRYFPEISGNANYTDLIP